MFRLPAIPQFCSVQAVVLSVLSKDKLNVINKVARFPILAMHRLTHTEKVF
jgi:hypothetical protein